MASIAFTASQVSTCTLYVYWASTAATYYYVYVDGILTAITNRLYYQFAFAPGEQPQVEVCDSATDVPAVAYPGNALMTWQGDSEATYYKIQKWIDSAWTTVRVLQATGQPFYQYRSPWLDDCTTHKYRIVPYNANDIAGSPMEFEFEMVRYPDAPEPTYTYDPETNELAIAA